MHWLEHKIPPPVVALLTAGAMWGVAQLGPPAEPSSHLRIAVAVTLAVIGAAFDIAGMIAFHRARTTLNPLAPGKASALVVAGVYRITRNPMYVGMAILLLAWAVQLASAWALGGPLLFVLYITKLQILPEERALSALFGPAFDAYRAKARRWV